MTKRKKQRRAKAAKPIEGPLVNEFAAQHGDYAVETLTVGPGELGHSGGRFGNVMVLRNRGGTAVERWLRRGEVDEAQASALALYCRAWRTVIGEQRVVANYHVATMIREVPLENFFDRFMSAKETLDTIEKRVFAYWRPSFVDAFKNVVLFDEPAGVVGSRLGYKNKAAETTAKNLVLFLADQIADVLALRGKGPMREPHRIAGGE